MSRKKRVLTQEDMALWDAVRHTVTPLRAPRRPLAASPLSEPPVELSPQTEPLRPKHQTPEAPPPRAQVKTPRSPVPFDTSLSRKLKRGTEEPVSRIDLHGFRQEEAHRALMAFLRDAQGRGARVVLVITGKGGRSSAEERGVLRRAVPQWLGSAEFRPLVVSLAVAHLSHGGDGAHYVHIRRRKSVT